MNLTKKILAILNDRRMPYVMVVDIAASFLRVVNYQRNLKRKSYDSGYHIGKAYAYYYVLMLIGYMDRYNPLTFGRESLQKDWACTFRTTYKINGQPTSFMMKKTLLKDALELLRQNEGPPMKWGKKMADEIKKECFYVED